MLPFLPTSRRHPSICRIAENIQQKTFSLIVLGALLLSACQARPGSLPTQPATATNQPVFTLTPTALPSATATATATSTPIPTVTPTPLPGLGVETSVVIGVLKDFFTFSPAVDNDGQTFQKGVSNSGFSTISLAGEPYLAHAGLTIDISKEEEPAVMAYWIVFLENTTHDGKDAANWVQNHFSEAVKNGQAEQVFGNARLTLQVSGANSQVLTIKVEP